MKNLNRRTFLKLSGVSAAMLALTACDELSSSFAGSTWASSGSSASSAASASSAPAEQVLPVVRDGQKIFEQINTEMTQRGITNIHLKYSAGLEHAIQADAQMFIDYGKAEIPAAEGDAMRGNYTEKMWDGLHESGYESTTSSAIMALKRYRVGVDLGYSDDGVYRLTKVYPHNAAEFQTLVDDLVSEYCTQDGDSYYKVGITVITIEDVNYWGAYIIPVSKTQFEASDK